jgi:polyisoprenoid-binding protein YceI
VRLSSLLALPTAAWLLLAHPVLAADYDLDASHSSIGFSVRHMMVSNTRGKFNKATGVLALDDKDVTKSTVTVEIDATSIDTSDAKRDEHLRNEDFFDVKKFPKITFKSTKVAKSGDKLLVTGDLAIKGVTKPVVLTVEAISPEIKDPFGGLRRGTTASTKINRKDFGLTWNKALDAGGLAVGEEIAIQLELEFTKQQPKADKKKP